jgi:hypothetical protein
VDYCHLPQSVTDWSYDDKVIAKIALSIFRLKISNLTGLSLVLPFMTILFYLDYDYASLLTALT